MSMLEENQNIINSNENEYGLNETKKEKFSLFTVNESGKKNINLMFFNEKIKEKMDLFVKNRNILMDNYKLENNYMLSSVAMMFTGRNVEINIKALKECESMIKNNTKWYSAYRGMVMLPLAAKMFFELDSHKYFDNVNKVYDMIVKQGWVLDDYRILAAMSIVDHVDDPEKYQEYVERSFVIYKVMQAEHPWLTGDEDVAFAVLLAVTDMDIAKLNNEMEKIYKQIMNEFYDINAAQTVSHILALYEEDADVKCNRVKELMKAFKRKNYTVVPGMEMMTVGALAMLDMPVNDIVDLVFGVNEELAKEKGYAGLSMLPETRHMYVDQLILAVYSEGIDNELIGNSLGVTISLEMSMSVCVAANTAIN